MIVHGLRIYRNDLLGIFAPAATAWRGHIFANDFGLIVNSQGKIDDPLPALREQYGPALLAADVRSQFALLRGDDFCRWVKAVRFCEGAWLPIFREAPPFELLTQLCYSRKFRLTPKTWPKRMRALLHMWDGVYWQIFTTERSDVDAVIRAHEGKTDFKMFVVDLEREYPDPSDEPLETACHPARISMRNIRLSAPVRS